MLCKDEKKRWACSQDHCVKSGQWWLETRLGESRYQIQAECIILLLVWIKTHLGSVLGISPNTHHIRHTAPHPRIQPGPGPAYPALRPCLSSPPLALNCFYAFILEVWEGLTMYINKILQYQWVMKKYKWKQFAALVVKNEKFSFYRFFLSRGECRY